jgi:hypothetical protein
MLSSCTFPQLEPIELCTESQALDYNKNASLETIEEMVYNSADKKEFKRKFFSTFGSCRCKLYDYMEVEGIGESVTYPLSKCKSLTGNSFKDFASVVRPFLVELKQYKQDVVDGK